MMKTIRRILPQISAKLGSSDLGKKLQNAGGNPHLVFPQGDKSKHIHKLMVGKFNQTQPTHLSHSQRYNAHFTNKNPNFTKTFFGGIYRVPLVPFIPAVKKNVLCFSTLEAPDQMPFLLPCGQVSLGVMERFNSSSETNSVCACVYIYIYICKDKWIDG